MSDYAAVSQQVARSSAANANGAGPSGVRLDRSGFQQATLQFEGGEPELKCWFNPGEYSITKTNSWDFDKVVGKALPVAQFGGGQPRKLTLDLLFDATDSPSRDVRAVTDRLFRMMEVDKSLASASSKNSGRPPMVTFAWGEVVSFKAVIESLSVQYTLFDQAGKPLRAQVKLSLTQAAKAEDASAQNPTTRGDVMSTHVVRDGDSLPSIAYAAYRNATAWRTIAEANDIDDPLRLRRGEVLTIPRRPA
jgi:Contractile injection system tube protein/LysM domain